MLVSEGGAASSRAVAVSKAIVGRYRSRPENADRAGPTLSGWSVKRRPRPPAEPDCGRQQSFPSTATARAGRDHRVHRGPSSMALAVAGVVFLWAEGSGDRFQRFVGFLVSRLYHDLDRPDRFLVHAVQCARPRRNRRCRSILSASASDLSEIDRPLPHRDAAAQSAGTRDDPAVARSLRRRLPGWFKPVHDECPVRSADVSSLPDGRSESVRRPAGTRLSGGVGKS